ncbi:MAG: hypothetical protein AAF363_16840 [Bacteroidota bacterium]
MKIRRITIVLLLLFLGILKSIAQDWEAKFPALFKKTEGMGIYHTNQGKTILLAHSDDWIHLKLLEDAMVETAQLSLPFKNKKERIAFIGKSENEQTAYFQYFVTEKEEYTLKVLAIDLSNTSQVQMEEKEIKAFGEMNLITSFEHEGTLYLVEHLEGKSSLKIHEIKGEEYVKNTVFDLENIDSKDLYEREKKTPWVLRSEFTSEELFEAKKWQQVKNEEFVYLPDIESSRKYYVQDGKLILTYDNILETLMWKLDLKTGSIESYQFDSADNSYPISNDMETTSFLKGDKLFQFVVNKSFGLFTVYGLSEHKVLKTIELFPESDLSFVNKQPATIGFLNKYKERTNYPIKSAKGFLRSVNKKKASLSVNFSESGNYLVELGGVTIPSYNYYFYDPFFFQQQQFLNPTINITPPSFPGGGPDGGEVYFETEESITSKATLEIILDGESFETIKNYNREFRDVDYGKLLFDLTNKSKGSAYHKKGGMYYVLTHEKREWFINFIRPI